MRPGVSCRSANSMDTCERVKGINIPLESRAVIGYPSGRDGAILPARDTGFVPQVHRSCFGVLSHIINTLLTKLARSRWLDIIMPRSFFACLCRGP